MVCGVPEGSDASGSRSERSSARDPENSLAENETAMKTRNIEPQQKNVCDIKGNGEMKHVGSKMVDTKKSPGSEKITSF